MKMPYFYENIQFENKTDIHSSYVFNMDFYRNIQPYPTDFGYVDAHYINWCTQNSND